MSGSLLYLILVQASLFACGASFTTLAILTWRRPRRWWGYALVKLSLLLVIGTVLLRILPHTIPHTLDAADPYVYAYITGVLLGCVGLVVVARDMMQHSGRRYGAGLAASSSPGPMQSDADAVAAPSKEEPDA